MIVPALLGLASFVLAFVQRPGLATADTKINLHVDPGRFLSDVASMWTSTGQLGGVQSGQQAGYVFPMGPFYALGHGTGLPDWVIQRLWLGLVLALAAWGVVRLLDALHPAPRGIVHLAGGAVAILNPFVVTYVNRTTVTLLAYAALPWLLLAVHRGLRDSRRWRWPAACALLVTASGGGINGAVTAWMLVGPLLLVGYEALFASVGWRSAGRFLLRAVPLGVAVSLWWLIPAYVQSAYGADFLHFTEQPGTVWGTTSATESLRLMGFWLSYVGIGFAGRAIPYFDDARTLLFSAPVVLGTLLLPAAALTGFVTARRWRYAPFFLVLSLAGVLIMLAGFPDGTPLRHGLTFTYNHAAAVRFLRASYKAAPLLAIGLAGLAAAGAGGVWEWLGRRSFAGWHPAWARAAFVAGAAAILVLAAWPMVIGHAQDRQVSYKRIPTAWTQTAGALDRRLARNSRAMVLPGELFSFYTWGGTVDPILPALSRRPIAERSQVPYSDLRATDLLWTTDALVHQGRVLPGQLLPLLRLIGVQSVLTATDSDLARSDAPAPADVAAVLAGQGLAHPAQAFGPRRSFAPTTLSSAVRLPEIRRYSLAGERGIVRVEPRQAPIVVDGSAGGIAGLAAFGDLAGGRPVLYAGDLQLGQLRRALSPGSQLVITDSNRRQAFVAGSLEQNLGPVLATDERVSADGIMLDPFARGPAFETVATYSGVRGVTAPGSPQTPQFPEHRPFAAIDGSTSTAWLADPTLGVDQRWLEVTFSRTVDVPFIDLFPHGDAGGRVLAVKVAGHRFTVHPGWNHLVLGLRGARSLRVTLVRVSQPVPGAAAGAGGIRELRIPGMRATEQLRLPIDAAAAAAGDPALAGVGLTYLFTRTTGDQPFRRDPAALQSAPDVRDPGDAESSMRRVFQVPAPRSFSTRAWVNLSPQAPDDVLDRLAGYAGPVDVTSSGRFDGQPGWRGSHALDGDPRTAWIAGYDPTRPAWLAFSLPSPLRIGSLRLIPPALPVRRPSVVRLVWPGGASGPLAVAADGRVSLAHPVSARRFRLEVLAAALPLVGASTADRRAIGIAEIRGIGGLPGLAVARRARFVTPCGGIRMSIDGRSVALRVSGSAAAFERGDPLPAAGCGSQLRVAAGNHVLVTPSGPFLVDALRLASPVTSTVGPVGSGRVLDSGRFGRASVDHVRVAVEAPSWLVLGQGYDRGWRAWCNGRALGAPLPLDGYANAWPVEPGCQNVHFAFAPQTAATVGYVVSAVAGLGCLAVLLLAALRLRRRRADLREAAAPAAARAGAFWPSRDPPLRSPADRALLWGILAACVLGFVFGVVAGAVSLPVIAFVLWRGVGPRPLTYLAGALLGVVVPVLYLAAAPSSAGGNHYSYPAQHMAAHWVGVAAIVLLLVALWRTLAGHGRAEDRAPRRAEEPVAVRRA